MKRIANKVSVQSICYTIPGSTMIPIVDLPAGDAEESAGVTVFDGEYRQKRYNDREYFNAECRRLTPWYDPETGDCYLVFHICTASEKY